MSTTAEILKAARKLIEKPENWTQGAFARNHNGHRVDSLSNQAVCFCAAGALMRVCYSDPSRHQRAKKELMKFAPSGIADFNDDASHSEVLELFSKAIAAAETAS